MLKQPFSSIGHFEIKTTSVPWHSQTQVMSPEKKESFPERDITDRVLAAEKLGKNR